MEKQHSAISKERWQRAFGESMTFRQFADRAQGSRRKLTENFESFELSEEELAYFATLTQPIEVLALVQDWCGDVVSNLPLFAKIEKETGKLNLRILNRDPDNRDIAEAYLHPDGRSHIPTYLFFDTNGEPLGTFIERPEAVTALFPKWREEFWELHPEWQWREKEFSEVEESIRKAYYDYLLAQRPFVQEEEKRAIIQILQFILTQ